MANPKKHRAEQRILMGLLMGALLMTLTLFLSGFSNSDTTASSHDAPADDVKRVVILHWQNAYADVTYEFDKGLRETLRSDSTLSLEIYTEYLQLDALTNPEIQEATLALLEKKYAAIKADVLIASEIIDSNYVLEHRERIFPNVPLVYLGISESTKVSSGLPENSTGGNLLSDIHGSIRLIQQMQPEVDKLLFIMGSGQTEAAYHRVIKNTMLQYSEQFTTTYTIDMSFNEILNLVKQLPPNTAVFYTGLLQDATGKGLNPGNSLKDISKHTTAPIYIFTDAYLDYDVVGGFVFNISEIGKDFGRRALAILHGEKAEDLKLTTFKQANVVRMDQLKKWQINTKDLPRDTLIIRDIENAADSETSLILLLAVFGLGVAFALIITFIFYRLREHKG